MHIKAQFYQNSIENLLGNHFAISMQNFAGIILGWSSFSAMYVLQCCLYSNMAVITKNSNSNIAKYHKTLGSIIFQEST